MNSTPNDAALPASGLPIRRSADQRLFSASPRLIAAVHVLLRLLVPRHPPCALSILTVSHPRSRAGVQITLLAFVQFSSSAEAAGAEAFRPRSLKTEQRHAERAPCLDPVDVGDRLPAPGGMTPAGSPEGRPGDPLPRKEVIQPQLPLRLPCYDFTPITSPTFDGSLPKGWATGFGCCPLSWCDGRCVQGPGTYSPRRC
jgi:hypothetical protein